MNPPCNSLIATFCIKFTMASKSVESRATAPFTEGLSSSSEGEWAIDEDSSTVSLARNPRVVPDNTVTVRKRGVCLFRSSEWQGGCSESSGFGNWGWWWWQFRQHHERYHCEWRCWVRCLDIWRGVGACKSVSGNVDLSWEYVSFVSPSSIGSFC